MTVLIYELESEAEYQYRGLLAAFNELIACKGIWHVSSKLTGQDAKRDAGATSLVNRKRVKLTKVPPPALQANIEVPTVPAGKQTLCFLPDRLLVFDRKGVGAVSYDALQTDVAVSRFVEEDGVPSDARIVDHTWQHPNKNGGPDKRFKNNRQLPVCAYENVMLSSSSGLNELFQLSRQGDGEAFKATLKSMTAARVMQ
jgi:hypothetical protein